MRLHRASAENDVWAEYESAERFAPDRLLWFQNSGSVCVFKPLLMLPLDEHDAMSATHVNWVAV